jgi:hypothetical protein
MNRTGEPAASITLDDPSPISEFRRAFSGGRGAAMPIHSFLQPGVFDPEALAAMSEAFESACSELDEARQPKVAPEVIAGRIIAAARAGERDPVRLRAAALGERLSEGDQG